MKCKSAALAVAVAWNIGKKGGVYDKETTSRYIKAGGRMVLSGSDHTYLLAARPRARRLCAARC